MKHLILPLIATSLLNTNDDMRMRNLENRITCLETAQSGCCIINPPARPYPADCWGFYVSVDPILWKASVNGLPLAIETSQGSTFFNNNGENRVKNLSVDWDFGVRVGVGLNTLHDGWDILLQWTHFDTNGRRHFELSNNAAFPSQGHPSNVSSFLPSTVSSTWDLFYNVLDIENGREFYVSKCLSLRPFAGLRSAWIKQEFDVKYSSTSFAQKIDKQDSTYGIGIRGGVDMQWGIGSNFSLFSNYAASLLYSYHSIHQKENSTFRVGDFYHLGNAAFDMQLGIRYDWFSCDCCYHLGFDLGWELHYYPSFNQFLNFADDLMVGKFFANQGDLGLQGYFIQVRFDF